VAAAGACEVMVTTTPGDVVGSVTERLLNVCVACTGAVCEVWETTVGKDVVVALVTETTLVLFIPRILSAVMILKQPTYTPAVVFIGTAKHESSAPQVVSL
jgi:hypothetical protein